MKKKTIIGALLGLALWPALAWCAEGGEAEGGSWLALLFYAINFAAFAFILAKYAAPMASRFFRDRAREIRETLSRSDANFRQAEEIASQSALSLARLEAEKKLLAHEMLAETQHEAARIRELATTAAARIKRDAELTAQAAAEEGRRRIRSELARVAAHAARQLIESNFEETDQDHLVEEFMKRIAAEARP